MSLKMSHSDTAVKEMIHGVTVLDPYQWLEDRAGPRTAAWIAAQQESCRNYFSRCSGLEAIRTRVRQFLEVEVLDQAARTETHFFYRRRNPHQEQACIYAKENGTPSERLLVDPSGYGPFASVNIHRISDDSSLLAYELRQGGTDTRAIHFADVSSGTQLRDELAMGIPAGWLSVLIRAGITTARTRHNSPGNTKSGFIGSALLLKRTRPSLSASEA